MNDGIRPYPRYNASGIDWLGEIPEHWPLTPLKWYLRVASGSFIAPITRELVQGNEIIAIGGNGFMGYVSESNVHQPTLAIGRVGVYCGNVHLVSPPAWITDNALVLSGIRGFNLTYLAYILRTANLNGLAEKSAQPLVTGTMVKGQTVPLPPEEEQEKIVRYIDAKTKKIDALIAMKQRLIELLNEKRAALISHAVTKGLDPNVPMKDSGIEWLGEIPNHWEVPRNRSLFSLFPGYAFKGEFFSKEEADGPKLVTPGNFNAEDHHLYFEDNNTVHYVAAYPKEYELAVGDLVIVMTDLSYKKLILGLCARVNQEGLLLNQRIAKLVFRPKVSEELCPDFVSYSLCSAPVREQVISTARGSTVFHSSPSKILDCHLALPPYEEQVRIANHLITESSKIWRASARIENSVQRLSEYRTALISAAVTGKIDVRDHVFQVSEMKLEQIAEDSA